MKSLARTALAVVTISLFSVSGFAQAASQTVSGTNPKPTPNTVSGTNPKPTPNTVSGTNPKPTPNTVSGTNPKPVSLGVLSTLFAALGY